MAKKDDKPYMPFYIGDWFKAPEVRALSHAHRMVWFEILCLMWQGSERGFLTINDKPFVITDDITGVITDGEQVLASMLGISCEFLQESFKSLKKFGVYKVREDGAVYSGFMVKLVENHKVKSLAGQKGMDKRYGKSVITEDITTDITSFEYENDINSNACTVVKTVIRGLGEVSISIHNNCKGWEKEELQKLIQQSEGAFQSIVMTRPQLNNPENFQLVLQDFVSMIQTSGDYKNVGEQKRHFTNWLNKKNGTLDNFIASLKSGKSNGGKKMVY